MPRSAISSNHPDSLLLDPEDAQNLITEYTLLSSPDDPNFWLLHKHRLHRWSAAHHPDTPIPSASNSHTSDLTAYSLLPKNVIYYSTLTYLSFAPAAATNIWTRWQNRLGRGERCELADFEKLVERYVGNTGEDTCSEDDAEWFRCMEELGLTQECQERFMVESGDDVYGDLRDVRLSESCKYWVWDTVRASFERLKGIREFSGERASAAREGSGDRGMG